MFGRLWRDLIVTLQRLFSAILDLFLLALPFRAPINPARVGFLIHDRDGTDLYRWLPAFRLLPQKVRDEIRWFLWPIRIRKITTNFTDAEGRPVEGWLLATILYARQMVSDRKRALRKIEEIIRLADKMGISIIGLGAYSASIAGLGEYLELVNLRTLPTTGHTFTVVAMVGNVQNVARELGIELSKITLGIVGAGSIGTACARYFSGKVAMMQIYDCDPGAREQLGRELAYLKQPAQLLTDLEEIRRADFVIVATTTPGAILTEHFLRQGQIIFDDSQPRNIRRNVAEKVGVLVIDAGIMNNPNIDTHFHFGLFDKHDHFGCLAEAVALAVASGTIPPTIGKPTLNQIQALESLVEPMGFIRVYRSFDQPINVATMIEIVSRGKSETKL